MPFLQSGKGHLVDKDWSSHDERATYHSEQMKSGKRETGPASASFWDSEAPRISQEQALVSANAVTPRAPSSVRL